LRLYAVVNFYIVMKDSTEMERRDGKPIKTERRLTFLDLHFLKLLLNRQFCCDKVEGRLKQIGRRPVLDSFQGRSVTISN